MPKVRITLSLDDAVLTATKVHAARTGRPDSEVVEDALRRMLGLDFLESMWSKAVLNDNEAMQLALEAQRAVD